MKRLTAVLLTALFLSAPVSALAGDKNARQANDTLSLSNTDNYRWKASTLEGKQRELGYRQQWVALELIDIYYRLAETKSAMADARDTKDRTRERLLEKQLYALKAEEGQLWAELERLNK